MGTLLLKLAAPLQAWGDESRYTERKTRHEPTKSAVIGLLAAALGRRREDDIDDIATLGVGIRADQPGCMLVDYHTAHEREYDMAKKRWKFSDDPNKTHITRRYYLSDAVFVAGIEVPDEKLDEYADALLHPVFPLYLGRRSCPPACKVLLGVRRDYDVRTALSETPWQASLSSLVRDHRRDERVRCEALFDAALGNESAGHYEDVRDEPVSFSQRFRQYEWRRVEHAMVEAPNPHYLNLGEEHDPFAALEGSE